MEEQLQRTHHRDPHHHAGMQSVVEGEGGAEHHNHHGEKKSVLTKVKNKAKKIKDKINHASHAHEGDDYDYDEGEETVHGAPIVNESEFISGTALPKQTALNLENPMNPLEDRQSRTARDEVYDDVGANTASDRNTRNEMYSSIRNEQAIETSLLLEDLYISNDRKEEYSGAGDVGDLLARLAMDAPRTNLADPPSATFDSEQRANVAEPMVKIGPLTGLEEDPHFPTTHHHLHPPNYETKVSDPTGQGGAEVDVALLVNRLGNLHVGGESEETDYTGSHDQFNPKSLDDESMLPRDTVADKMSAATAVIADKTSSAKDVVASKLGYGGSSQEVEEPARKGALESVSEYGHIVVEKLAPVYEKAAGAGSSIMSKMQRDGGGVVEKFSPGEEDRELSKAISSALRGEGQQQQVDMKKSARVEAVVSDDKAAAGVVDRVKGAIGSWLGKN